MDNSLSLTMVFKDSSGNKCPITVPNIKDNVTEGEITSVMNALLNSNVIPGKDGALVLKDSAYITRKETTGYKLNS